MGEPQAEIDDKTSEQEDAASLQDQATALLAEVRELREGYESLTARIDQALAAGQAEEEAVRSNGNDREGAASDVELYLLNLALSGHSREETAALFAQQFGDKYDEELLDKVFGSAPVPDGPRRRRFRRAR